MSGNVVIFPKKKEICNKKSLSILFLIFVPNFTQKWIVGLRKKNNKKRKNP
jgi:hypothetical protein